MFENISDRFWQYGILIIAIVALVSLKAFTVKSKYTKELQQFVHPSVFMEEIKKKVKSAEQAENILSINLDNSIDHNRLRNISILVTYINEEEYKSKCTKTIKNKLASLQNLSDSSKKYVNYINEATKNWD